MHAMEGTYRSESGREIDYKAEFTVQGDSFT